MRWLVGIGVHLFGALLTVFLRQQVLIEQYELGKLEQKYHFLLEKKRDEELEIARLESISRLQELAKNHGLEPPSLDHTVHLRP